MDHSGNTLGAPRLLSLVRGLVLGMRPKQWSKNLVIYLAFFFTIDEAWDPSAPLAAIAILGEMTLAFVIFSALTGAVYLVNDIFDAERDRSHPLKRKRPIASGQLPVPAAWTASAILILGGVAAALVLNMLFGIIAVAYVLSMMLYSMAVKHMVLLDVFTISAGFVLRTVAGAAILGVPISPWLYICTALGALLLGLSKRRSELVAAGDNAASQRGTLQNYTTQLLDQLLTIVATSAVLAYSLYTFTAANLPENHSMMLTIPFVVYGVFRYMFLVHNDTIGESVEDILTDPPMVISIALWLVSAAVILGTFRT